MFKNTFSLLLFWFVSCFSIAQNNQNHSADETNLPDGSGTTAIGGYGTAFYKRDFNDKTATVDLDRAVVFISHDFGIISFLSELEIEHAKVSHESKDGEVAFEQAYLKFMLNRDYYITAGLFIPRIGRLNEYHLPHEFYGNERNRVETFILPSTWRELGVGLYGRLNTMPLNFSVALINGLDSRSFEHGSGIREGRYEGKQASANNFALTGAVGYSFPDWKLQVSGYYGGTIGLNSEQADSLHLTSGMFGTPVGIIEADFQYEANGLHFAALGVSVSIAEAKAINQAFNNNIAEKEYGFYIESGYDFLHCCTAEKKQLIGFVRYEKLDMNSTVPPNGVFDGTLNQKHIVFGLHYLPAMNVVIKADVRISSTGDENPAVTSALYSSIYKTTNTIFTFGVGYSF